MREDYAVGWAFAIQGTIEKVVRQEFPDDLRKWPILQGFDFKAYLLNDRYMIIILQDKLSGIPSGPGTPSLFPYSGYPSIPPILQDIEAWQQYLEKTFSLRNEDVAVLIPVKDLKANPVKEYAIYSVEEKKFWHYQLHYVITKQKAHIQSTIQVIPIQPVNNITYNVSGANARVNISSEDNSINMTCEEK